MITKYSNNTLIDSFFNDLLFNGTCYFPNRRSVGYSNNINLERLEDKYTYQTIATGLTKEDINIDFEGNHLIIKSNKKEDCRFVHNLNHKIKLEEAVDITNITASLENGILEINLPYDKNKKSSCSVTFI